jgi:hypothetical protein
VADYYWKVLLAPQKKSLLVIAQQKPSALDPKWLSGFDRINDIPAFKQDRAYYLLK